MNKTGGMIFGMTNFLVGRARILYSCVVTILVQYHVNQPSTPIQRFSIFSLNYVTIWGGNPHGPRPRCRRSPGAHQPLKGATWRVHKIIKETIAVLRSSRPSFYHCQLDHGPMVAWRNFDDQTTAAGSIAARHFVLRADGLRRRATSHGDVA
jgi:hypothetical protein